MSSSCTFQCTWFVAVLIFIIAIAIPEREAASGKATAFVITYDGLSANCKRPFEIPCASVSQHTSLRAKPFI